MAVQGSVQSNPGFLSYRPNFSVFVLRMGAMRKYSAGVLAEPSVFKVGEAMPLGHGVIHTRGSLPLGRGVQRCPAWGAASPAMARAGE